MQFLDFSWHQYSHSSFWCLALHFFHRRRSPISIPIIFLVFDSSSVSLPLPYAALSHSSALLLLSSSSVTLVCRWASRFLAYALIVSWRACDTWEYLCLPASHCTCIWFYDKRNRYLHFHSRSNLLLSLKAIFHFMMFSGQNLLKCKKKTL